MIIMSKENLTLNETFDLALKNHQKPNLFRVLLNYSFKYEIPKHLKKTWNNRIYTGTGLKKSL